MWFWLIVDVVMIIVGVYLITDRQLWVKVVGVAAFVTGALDLFGYALH